MRSMFMFTRGPKPLLKKHIFIGEAKNEIMTSQNQNQVSQYIALKSPLTQ